MKYGWLTAAALLVLVAITACGSFWCFHHIGASDADHDRSALAWLHEEFDLPGEKMKQIEQAHVAYQAICAGHCREIVASREELHLARESGASADSMTKAMERVAAVDRECISATQNHLQEIAAIIGGAEGKRYLDIVLPRLAHFDHQGPASLDLQTDHTHAEHSGG